MADPRWAKIGRDLTAHKVRTALVVLSIAVGVFAILVVLGGRGMLIESFDTNFPASAPANAFFNTSDFDEQLVHAVERQPGIRAAEGRRAADLRYRPGDLTGVEEPAAGETVAERAKSIEIVASGDWATARVERVFPDEGVTWPPAPGEIVVERSATQEVQLKAGDLITVDLGGGRTRVLRVSGFALDINAFPAMFSGRLRGFVTMSEMRLLDQPEEFNQLAVVMDVPDLTREQASRIAATLKDDVLGPRGVRVYSTQVPEPGSHFLGDIFRALAVLLLALGVLAALLSGFLVVNTVAGLVAQQTRQIGIMKAVGGRSGQIMRMYLSLVIIYGLLAALIALPVGTWLAAWFAQFAGGLLNFGETTAGPPPYALALALATGILVPIAAAFIPLRTGTRVSVVRALNSRGATASAFGHGLIDRFLGTVRGLPRPIAFALRNTFLRKGRLAMTLATLSLASAVVMSVMTVRTSMLRTVSDISRWWRYDVEVSFQQPVGASGIERQILDTPGVKGAESWLVHYGTMKRADGTENQAVGVIGLPATTSFVQPEIVSGRWLEPGDEDAVVVNTDLAGDESLEPGSRITLEVRGVEHVFRIVGVIRGQLGGSVVYADRTSLGRVLGETGAASRVVVFTSDHTDAGQRTSADRLERKLTAAGYAVSGVRTQRAMSTALGNELGLLVTFLIIMAAILAAVGAIGLSGTMVINVLESTREIGVMRAVGASHASIFQVFVTEGVLVGLMSWAIGAIVCYPMSRGLVGLLEVALTFPLSFEFSWSGLGLWLLVVMGISALASLLPSLRASQVSVRDAIAYE